MTKQQIIDAVLECAERLGRAPSQIELAQQVKLSRKALRGHFGTHTALLAECNLTGKGSGYKATMEELFRDWAELARALKKPPTIIEYELKSRFSVRPLVTRFGTWKQVPMGLKLYAEEQVWAEEWKDILAMVETREEQGKAKRALMSKQGPGSARRARRLVAELGPNHLPRAKNDGEVYGPLMRLGPMVCAPTNEQGVLFLFGAMAEELGFAVLKIRTEYPDCEAFRVIEGGRMERVKIEFEYESRNFLKHLHDVKKCNLIVCWRHNWKECPLEVIALGELTKLP